ncbi:hypothetical protein B9Z52_12460 [Limnohabitans sp. Jir72]|nr:hypothetical protein B9Z52_12460 [Limnohabitans sp. Jir72]
MGDGFQGMSHAHRPRGGLLQKIPLQPVVLYLCKPIPVGDGLPCGVCEIAHGVGSYKKSPCGQWFGLLQKIYPMPDAQDFKKLNS